MRDNNLKVFDCVTLLFEKNGYKALNIVDILSILYKAHKECLLESSRPLIAGDVVCHDLGIFNELALELLSDDSEYCHRLKNDIFYMQSTDKGNLSKFTTSVLENAYKDYFINGNQNTRNLSEFKDHYMFNKNVKVQLLDLLMSYGMDQEQLAHVMEGVELDNHFKEIFNQND